MSLSVSEFVDVVVNLGAVAVGSASYDTGLILVDKADWPVAITTRTAEYSNTREVITAGFNANIQGAVNAYFAQNPSPDKVVLGYYDSTASTPETPAQGLAACRTDNGHWYTAAILDPSDSLTAEQLLAVATATEAFDLPSVFFYQTTDSNCLVGNTSNIMASMKEAAYNRSFGFYVDGTNFATDNSLKYVAIAASGRVCGLNSKEANTAFALAFKNLVGISSVDLTDAQFNVLKGYNGNAYLNVSRGKYFFIMSGVAASGAHYDEIYCLDLLKSEIESNVLNLFSSSLVVPQTDAGVSMIVNKVVEACDTVADVGFIAPGIWNGPNIKTLRTGDALPSGYAVMHDSIYEQSQTEREQRVSPTMYVCIKLAGAVEFLTVVVNVNR